MKKERKENFFTCATRNKQHPPRFLSTLIHAQSLLANTSKNEEREHDRDFQGARGAPKKTKHHLESVSSNIPYCRRDEESGS